MASDINQLVNALLGLPQRPRRKRQSPGLPGRETQRVGRNAQPKGVLSRERRQNIRQRARQQVRKEFRPEQQLLQRQRNRLERRQGRALQADASASSMFQAATQGALAGLDKSGLKGAYAKQVAQDISQQGLDVARSVPQMQRLTRQEFRPEFQQLADARFGLKSDRVSALQQAIAGGLSDAREQRIETLEAQGPSPEERQDRRTESRTAISVAERLLGAYPGQAPESDKEWLRFEEALAKSEGVSPLAAKRAVEEIRRRQRAEETGVLLQHPVFGPLLRGAAGSAATVIQGAARLGR